LIQKTNARSNLLQQWIMLITQTYSLTSIMLNKQIRLTKVLKEKGIITQMEYEKRIKQRVKIE
jgi:hypothetical protein